MTQITHTDEEIRRLLQALFFEKKRVKELEHQLQSQPQTVSSPTSEETHHPKESLTTVQQELEKTTALLQDANRKVQLAEEENDAFRKQHKVLIERLQKAEQQAAATPPQRGLDKGGTERLYSIIQEREKRIAELQQYEFSYKKAAEQRYEMELLLDKEKRKQQPLVVEKEKLAAEVVEKQQHVEQLERVIQFLRERSEEAHLEANQLQEEYQKIQENNTKLSEELKAASQEMDEQGKALFHERNQKNEIAEELQTLQGQFELLKQTVQASRQSASKYEVEASQASKVAEELKSEKGHLEELLRQKTVAFESVEHEIVSLKEELSRGQRDIKQIEKNYLESVNEKVIAVNKWHQLQQEIASSREEVEIRRGEDQSKIAQFKSEVEKLVENLAVAQSVNEERDAQFKMAQHHLAKKVKENATLADQLETYKAQHQELLHAQSHLMTRVTELQTALDLQVQHEKRLQNQLTESLRSVEAQLGKWEDKYFRLHDKWQEAESKIQELKKFEEKHSQLQSLLSNLGSVMGHPIGISQPMISTRHEEPVKEPVVEIPIPEAPPKIAPKPSEQDLFNKTQSVPRSRKNLFD